MRDLITVASYTIKEMVKRKSFIISTLVILVLIVVGFNVPNIINTIKGDKQQELGTDTIVIIDQDNIFEGTLESLNSMQLGKKYVIETKAVSNDELKEKIEKEEIYGAIRLSKQDNQIQAEYVVDSIGMNGAPTELLDIFAKLYNNVQLSKLGLTQQQLENINPSFDMSVTQVNENPASGNIFSIMLLSIVLFYAIYFCAYQVSSSITTEKTSKIMETLVTSTTPRTIVLGKTIGIGIVGLIQVATIILVSVISCQLFLDPQLLSNIIDVSKVTPLLAIMVIVYFVLGYALFSLLYALTGSTVSKPEDINSANTPVAMIAVVAFYLSYFSMMNPTSELNVFVSLFPFTAPFSMPFRVMMGTATPMQLVISLGIMLVSIFIIARISIKIYSSAILNYGTKMSMKDIFKMYRDKNN